MDKHCVWELRQASLCLNENGVYRFTYFDSSSLNIMQGYAAGPEARNKRHTLKHKKLYASLHKQLVGSFTGI